MGRCKAWSTTKDFYRLWDEGNAGGGELPWDYWRTTNGRQVDQMIHVKNAKQRVRSLLERHQSMGICALSAAS